MWFSLEMWCKCAALVQYQPSGVFHVGVPGQDITYMAVDCSLEPAHAFRACVVDEFGRVLDRPLSGCHC